MQKAQKKRVAESSQVAVVVPREPPVEGRHQHDRDYFRHPDTQVERPQESRSLRLLPEVGGVINIGGCCHSSVDSSAPTILPIRVQVPSTPSKLFPFIVNFLLYLSFKKNVNKQKAAGFCPVFLKKWNDWRGLKIKAKNSKKYFFIKKSFSEKCFVAHKCSFFVFWPLISIDTGPPWLN